MADHQWLTMAFAIARAGALPLAVAHSMTIPRARSVSPNVFESVFCPFKSFAIAIAARCILGICRCGVKLGQIRTRREERRCIGGGPRCCVSIVMVGVIRVNPLCGS